METIGSPYAGIVESSVWGFRLGVSFGVFRGALGARTRIFRGWGARALCRDRKLGKEICGSGTAEFGGTSCSRLAGQKSSEASKINPATLIASGVVAGLGFQV